MSDSSCQTIILDDKNPFNWGREVNMKIAELQEQRIKDAIIGAKITDIQFNKIRNRKTMYELVIQTDAGEIPCLTIGSGYMLGNRALIQESDRHFFDLSEIRVRTKNPAFDSSHTTKKERGV